MLTLELPLRTVSHWSQDVWKSSGQPSQRRSKWQMVKSLMTPNIKRPTCLCKSYASLQQPSSATYYFVEIFNNW